MLKVFGIYSEVPVDDSKSIVTKREKVRNSSVLDLRPIKKNIPKYQAQTTQKD
mgnify:FL=1